MLHKIYREIKQIWSGYGVPFVGTPKDKLSVIIENIVLEEGEVFLDLGSGDGRVLEALEEKYAEATLKGYESSYYPYSLAVKRKQSSGGNYEVFHQDVFTISFQEAQHIFIYMVPYMVQRLAHKIKAECKSGTKIYIQSHKIDGWSAEKVVPLSEKNNLYIYIL